VFRGVSTVRVSLCRSSSNGSVAAAAAGRRQSRDVLGAILRNQARALPPLKLAK
jgi:hypothetical protein